MTTIGQGQSLLTSTVTKKLELEYLSISLNILPTHTKVKYDMYTVHVHMIIFVQSCAVVRWPSAFACPVTMDNAKCSLPTFDPTWNVSFLLLV